MSNEGVEIQELSINDYKLDVTGVQQISIYNTLEMFGYTLELMYNDITDVKGKMPLKGGETLNITLVDQYKTKFKKSFIIRKVESSAINADNSVLVIKSISSDGFGLGINRSYNSFNNMTASQIVKTYLPNIVDAKPTSDVLNLVIPGWMGTKALNYVCSFTNNYYVFEKNSGFVFAGLEDLLIPSEVSFNFSSNNQKERYFIVDFKEIQLFNTVNETYDNIYSNVYKMFNPATKSITTVKKTIQEEQAQIKTLGSGENFSASIAESISPKISMVPYSPNTLSYSKNMDKMFNKSFQILINGDLEHEVGDTVNLRFIEMFNNNPDELLSGLYLIVKIAHHISSAGFFSKIEVQKNAYYKGNIPSNTVL